MFNCKLKSLKLTLHVSQSKFIWSIQINCRKKWRKHKNFGVAFRTFLEQYCMQYKYFDNESYIEGIFEGSGLNHMNMKILKQICTCQNSSDSDTKVITEFRFCFVFLWMQIKALLTLQQIYDWTLANSRT